MRIKTNLEKYIGEEIDTNFLKEFKISPGLNFVRFLVMGALVSGAACEMEKEDTKTSESQDVAGTCIYEDNDKDGFGNPQKEICNETVKKGYVTNKLDCDDNNENINLEAEEICGDKIDNNCNGEIDEIVSCLECYYKCDLADQFEVGEKGKGYSSDECVDWNKSICGPDNPGLLLDNYESISVELKALAKSDFLKVGVIGGYFDVAQPLRVRLDGLSFYEHELTPNDDCNPIVIPVFDLLNLTTNIDIVEDETVKIILSLGSPQEFGTLCKNAYSTNEAECGAQEGNYAVPTTGCKYGLTKIVLASCSYCNPEKDSTCYLCSPKDPACNCKIVEKASQPDIN